MLRNFVAVVAGMIVGMVVNMALVMLNGYVLFPMPDGLDMNDVAGMNAYIQTLPTAAFVVVLAAHLGQSFVGGWVAARLAASHATRVAMVIGVLSLVGGILNAMQLQLPTWMYIEFPLYLVCAWLAGGMETKRRDGLTSA